MLTARIFQGDSLSGTTKEMLNADHLITDADYDLSSGMADLLLTEFPGNVVAFVNPSWCEPAIPDERLYWVKPRRTMNYKNKCGRFVETILVYRHSTTFNELYWPEMTGVYFDNLEERPIHKHQKPLSLMRRLVRIYTNPGDTVLDPFLGYGTTGLACLMEGRNFIGVDIDPYWVEKATTRMWYHAEGFRAEITPVYL